MNIVEYSGRLRQAGFNAVLGSENTVWVSHERFSMIRQPVFALHAPSDREMKQVFHSCRSLLLTFAVTPSNKWLANSRVYICTDNEYSLERIPKTSRSQIRRGLSEFEIRPLDQRELVMKGAQAYCDTIARTGQSGATPESFKRVFERDRPDRKYIGALKGDRLAAFYLVTEVEDWVSIGGFSATEFLPFCPNNALVYYLAHHYLVERRFRVATYGLSSIQDISNEAGLDRFKKNMGFESVPVHRAFVVNPFLRPLANRISWKLVNGILKLSPKHHTLKKVEGALRMALQRYNG